MTDAPIPLFVLAGRDPSAHALPPGSREHPLVAYKGAELRIDGRPMVSRLADAVVATGRFDPVFVVGPRRRYRETGLPVIDTDGHLAENVRAAVERFSTDRDAGAMAFLTCDVLPTADELRAATRELDAAESCPLFYPLIRAPGRESLAASAWKPSYRVRPDVGADPVEILPGHLVVVDPRAIRLELTYRLLDVAYRTRNEPVERRRRSMVRRVLGNLLWEDVRHLLGARVPDLTWSVLTSGTRLARGLRAGVLTRAELERLVGRLALRHAWRRRHPSLAIRLPIVDALGLALDIDTEEEAAERGAVLRRAPPS